MKINDLNLNLSPKKNYVDDFKLVIHSVLLIGYPNSIRKGNFKNKK